MECSGRFATFLIGTWAIVVSAQDNPRHIDLDDSLRAVATLDQHWSNAEANWFYNAAQGSQLLPYDWLIHLEQSDSQTPFLAADHIRALGYIARLASADNPDGLPIGFIKDARYKDGTASVGLACAACHTAQINHKGVAYIIDGGPTMGDMQKFMNHLADALHATAFNDAKFDRFAAKVLPSVSSEDTKKALRSGLKSKASARAAYNDRNFPSQESRRFGHGRVDAFGAIFNEVSATFLGISDNVNPASAPVSYPCLWDAPQHDRVQWNGAAQNRKSDLGSLLFGTTEVGALGRNSGEVLGVFGHAEINADELIVPRPYPSTVDKQNLLAIENTLKTLWSPLWPEAFGAIDPDQRLRGKALYEANCQTCHHPIDRESPTRSVQAKISAQGTDPTMAANFSRTGSTGKLEGRRITLLGHEHFEAEAPVALILKHVVERVILKNLPIDQLKAKLAGKFSSVNELNPGYQNTAVVKIGNKEIGVSLDSLNQLDNRVKVKSSKSDVLDFANNVREELTDDAAGNIPLRNFGSARAQVGHVIDFLQSSDDEASAEIEVDGASVALGYKARPLNGIWATAPYLHNGSVPTLAELLKPASQRIHSFHVGSLEFDPNNVGFVDDPTFPVFDTSINGNYNTGHEHGSQLSPEQKRDLIEYLKSL